MDFLNSANAAKRKILLAFFLISASFFISVNLIFAGPKCDGAPDGGGECKDRGTCSFDQLYDSKYNDCGSIVLVCCKKTAGAAPQISRCVQYGNGTCTAGTNNKCPNGTIYSSYYDDCGGGLYCCVPEVRVPQTQAQVQNGGVTPASPAAISSSNSGAMSGLVPCRNSCTLCHIILGFKRIFDFLLGMLFTATMLVITVAGVFYMVSTGSKGMIDKAKKALTYGLLAFVIGMGSWLFVNLVMDMLGYQHPAGGSWWQFTCDETQTVGPAVTSPGSTLASGAAAGRGSGSYTPSGNLDPRVQKVLGNYMTMDGMTYGQSFDNAYGGRSTAVCGSTVSRAWLMDGLPDYEKLTPERWDGDPNSLKPGDICLFDKKATNIDHAFMIMDQNGMTTAAGGSSNTIRTSANGLNSNIDKLKGNTRNLFVFHIANYLK